MPLEQHPELSAVLRDPLWAARQSQRPVVAFASNNVPVELIHAAGCFPLQLPTAPRADTARADHYLESRFDPLVRNALEQLLAGELACARLVALPRSVDSWQRLYYYLCELTRSFGERVPEPFLYDILHTPFDTSADYNLLSTRAFADKLAAISGTLGPVPEHALASSIALYNRVRDRLRAMSQLRHALPCQLAGADALELYTAAQRLDPAVFEHALETLLARGGSSAPGVRTLLVGSAHDTPALHQLIARCGGQVVADFHARGDLLFGPNVRDEAPALQALSEHYHRQSVSARTYPPPLTALLDLADMSRAEAAVFFYYAEEEALTWDHPEQQAALRARGLTTLLLDREAYPPSADLEPRLRQFFAEFSPSVPSVQGREPPSH